MKRALYLLTIIASAIIASAQEGADDAVIKRLETADDPMLTVPSLSFGNPAVKQWQSGVSLSGVGAAYHNRGNDRAKLPIMGDGERYFSFEAESYMKYKTSTLWGGAFYNNGKQFNLQGCETSDYQLVYPYVTADAVGGDMNLERYSFAGGYADERGRWSWGGMIDYTAGLYYRNVDPRPRNVTGQFNMSAGAGYNVAGDYVAALSLHLRRYTQSSSIDFKSEMGVEKIYHLTGLGNHYARFAGLGLSSSYTGYRYGVSANLFPKSRRGVALSVFASRFTFDKILNDLNELPMASVWHNAVSAQAAWLQPGESVDWAVSADFDAYRRHGNENIFGDASSNIYPQIGTLGMYADNHFGAAMSALVSVHTERLRLWWKPQCGYSYREEVYADPIAQEITRAWKAAVETGGDWTPNQSWYFSASAGYRFAEHYGNYLSASAEAARAISRRYAIGVGASYMRRSSNDNILEINIKLYI